MRRNEIKYPTITRIIFTWIFIHLKQHRVLCAGLRYLLRFLFRVGIIFQIVRFCKTQECTSEKNTPLWHIQKFNT
jgi:hypothetical protein